MSQGPRGNARGRPQRGGPMKGFRNQSGERFHGGPLDNQGGGHRGARGGRGEPYFQGRQGDDRGYGGGGVGGYGRRNDGDGGPPRGSYGRGRGGYSRGPSYPSGPQGGRRPDGSEYQQDEWQEWKRPYPNKRRGDEFAGGPQSKIPRSDYGKGAWAQMNRDIMPQYQHKANRYLQFCSLCTFNTNDDKEMDAHMESREHKASLKMIDKGFPQEKKLSLYLHEKIKVLNKKIVMKKEQWGKEAGHAYTPIDPLKGFWFPDCMLSMKVLRCPSCRTYIPAFEKELRSHLESARHIANVKASLEMKLNKVKYIAKCVLTKPNDFKRYEKYLKGEDAFLDNDDEEGLGKEVASETWGGGAKSEGMKKSQGPSKKSQGASKAQVASKAQGPAKAQGSQKTEGKSDKESSATATSSSATTTTTTTKSRPQAVKKEADVKSRPQAVKKEADVKKQKSDVGGEEKEQHVEKEENEQKDEQGDEEAQREGGEEGDEHEEEEEQGEEEEDEEEEGEDEEEGDHGEKDQEDEQEEEQMEDEAEGEEDDLEDLEEVEEDAAQDEA